MIWARESRQPWMSGGPSSDGPAPTLPGTGKVSHSVPTPRSLSALRRPRLTRGRPLGRPAGWAALLPARQGRAASGFCVSTLRGPEFVFQQTTGAACLPLLLTFPRRLTAKSLPCGWLSLPFLVTARTDFTGSSYKYTFVSI